MEPLLKTGGFPDILLARQSKEPLYEQITRQLAESIRDGKLGGGCRLPSTPVLARLLGVSRNTVLIAYETLAARNLIRNVHGSGARVSTSAPVKLPSMASVLSAAMYPEMVTIFDDPDGNPLYMRHPDRFRG